MPFVVCPSCPKAFYVATEDVVAAKEMHAKTHRDEGASAPDFLVFADELKVPVTWLGQCSIAANEGQWKPKTSVERG